MLAVGLAPPIRVNSLVAMLFLHFFCTAYLGHDKIKKYGLE